MAAMFHPVDPRLGRGAGFFAKPIVRVFRA
jgi:hypothetical protein